VGQEFHPNTSFRPQVGDDFLNAIALGRTHRVLTFAQNCNILYANSDPDLKLSWGTDADSRNALEVGTRGSNYLHTVMRYGGCLAKVQWIQWFTQSGNDSSLSTAPLARIYQEQHTEHKKPPSEGSARRVNNGKDN